jgi:hypothetical protein
LEKLKVTNIASFGRLEELETGENRTAIQERVDRKVTREFENSFTQNCQMLSKKKKPKGASQIEKLVLVSGISPLLLSKFDV